jgi:hypothetical protein
VHPFIQDSLYEPGPLTDCNELVPDINNIENKTPVEPDTRITFPNPLIDFPDFILYLPEQAEVRLDLYDLVGNSIEVILQGIFPPGKTVAPWNASGLKPGIYIFRYRIGDSTVSKLLVKP